jgi:hypothetical protein
MDVSYAAEAGAVLDALLAAISATDTDEGEGRTYLGQNVSEHDVAPVTPIRRSADGERQSLYFAHAMCTDRNLVAGVARARLPYAANMVSEWTQLGVHVARGLEPRRRRRG